MKHVETVAIFILRPQILVAIGWKTKQEDSKNIRCGKSNIWYILKKKKKLFNQKREEFVEWKEFLHTT